MSQRAKTPQELYGQEPECRRLVNEELDLSERKKAILNVVLDYSLKKGKEWAIFDCWELLGGLAGIERTHASTEASELQKDGLLNCKRRRGDIRCRFLPGGVLVPPAPKIEPRERIALAARADELNAHPDGFEPGGQKQLDLKTVEEKLEDDLAHESRERAKHGAGGSLELPIVPTSAERTESVHSSETYRIGTLANVPNRYVHSRGRAGAGDHDHERNDNDHDHDSGAAGKPEALRAARRREHLSKGGRELFDELKDAIEDAGEEMKIAYEFMWAPRIAARPHDVLDALQDAKRMKTEEKIKKSFGGTLNRLYLDYSGERPAPYRR